MNPASTRVWPDDAAFVGLVESLARRFGLAAPGTPRRADFMADIAESQYAGTGFEYIHSRPYQLGDSIRSIDWRLTARTGELSVREYETTRGCPVYIVLDRSASMAFSSTATSKYAWALPVTGALALAALDRLGPVSWVLAQRPLHRAGPSRSPDRLFRDLLGWRELRFDEKTPVSRALAGARQFADTPGLVIVASDLHDPMAPRELSALSARHEVIVLWWRDPAEAGRIGAGVFRAREAETGRRFLATGRDRWLDPSQMEEELRRAVGERYVALRSNEDCIPALAEFMRLRSMPRRGRRLR